MKRGVSIAIIVFFLIVTTTNADFQFNISELDDTKTEPVIVKTNASVENKLNEQFNDELLGNLAGKLKDKFKIKYKNSEALTYRKWKDKDKLRLKLYNHTIENIEFNKVKKFGSLKLDHPKIAKAKQTYAIDPSDLDFKNATVTITAEGQWLYKCADWDYDTGICPPATTVCNGGKGVDCETKGGWVKIKKLVPGRKYTITITPDDPAFAEYDSTLGAPYCAGGESPCIAGSNLLRSKDSLATPEPNQPNTVDGCTDGTSGTYLTDESAENLTVTSLNGSYFRQGDTINVTATFLCWDTVSDNLNYVYANDTGTPTWTVKTFTDPCPTARPSFYTETKQFTLDDVNGTHAVRIINQYNGNTATTCGGGAYDDNDDLAFKVYTYIPPNVTINLPVENTTYNLSDNVTIDVIATDDDSAVRSVKANVTFPDGTSTIVNLSKKIIGEVQSNLTINGSWRTINFSNTYTNPVVFASPLTFNDDKPAEVRMRNIGSNSFEIRAQEPTGDYPEPDNHSNEMISLLVIEEGVHQLTNGEYVEVHNDLSTTTVSGTGPDTWTTYSYNLTHATTPVILAQVQTYNSARFVTTSRRNVGTASFQMSMEVAQDNASAHPNENIGWLAIKETGSTANSTIDDMRYSSVISADSIRGRGNGCYAAAHGLGVIPEAVLGMQSTRDGGNGGWARYCNDVNTWTSANTYWTIDEVDNGERSHTTERVSFIAFNTTGNITDPRYWDVIFNQTTQTGRYNITIIANDTPGNINDTETTYFVIPSTPNVTLINPPNGSTTNNLTVNFICNATDKLGLRNITLYIWNSTGSLVQTNSTTATGKKDQYSINVTLTQGTYDWNCEAYTTYSESAFAPDNYTITIFQGVPNVTITRPANGTQYKTGDVVLVEANITSQISISNGTLQIEFPAGTYTNYSMITQRTEIIDGNISAWKLQERQGTDINDGYLSNWDAKQSFAINDQDYFYGRLDVYGTGGSGIDTGTYYYQMYFDVDQSNATGYSDSGQWTSGYDYLVENGNIYNYTGIGGAWGWTLISTIDYNVSTNNESIEWAINRTTIGMQANSSAMNLLFSSGNGSINDYIPPAPFTNTFNYTFFNTNTYRYWFNETTQQGRYNITVYGEDTGGNIGTDTGWFTTIFATNLTINETKDPVENGEVFYFWADYEYTNGSDILGATCIGEILNKTVVGYYELPVAAVHKHNQQGDWDAVIFRDIVGNFSGTDYKAEFHLGYNGTNNKDFYIWIRQNKTEWNSSQTPDYIINQTTNPELNSSTQEIFVNLSDSDFPTSGNYTMFFGCSGCNSTDYYFLGEDTNNFGHSYEAIVGGNVATWDNMTLKNFEFMAEIELRNKPFTMSYDAGDSRYEQISRLYLYKSVSKTYDWNATCTKTNHETQTDRTNITVSNNYAPVPNITSVTPNPALYGVDNVTVVWNNDVSGKAFGITTSYVNLTYPNGTFAAQYQGSPFEIPTSVLNVIGTYNLTAFSENSQGSGINTSSFAVEYPAPSVVILTPLGETYNNYRAVTIAANVTSSNGIDKVIANITRPNGTENQIELRTTINDDTFDNSSQWQNYTWDLAPGQQCTNEITGGKMHIKINGTGTGSETQCGFVGKKMVYSDFNATIDYNISILNDEKQLVFLFTEEENRERGYQVRINYERELGVNKLVAAIEQSDNYTTLGTKTITTTTGTIGISRQNNTFTYYYINGTNAVTIATTNATLQKGLYPRIFTVSYTPNWYEREIYLDKFNITERSNTYLRNYENTGLNGTYNVTIIANNTYGTINDTEETNFTILKNNTAPTIPIIYSPFGGAIINGNYSIAWEEVDDFQNDKIKLNITLLDENGTYYQDIVTNLSNKVAPNVTYLWDTTTAPNGYYLMRITAYENETAEHLSSSYTMPHTFIINQEAPTVEINSPLGENYDQDSNVPLSANITDPDGIDTAYATVGSPNGSSYNVTLTTGFQGDSFDTDTLGTIWRNITTIGTAQTCVRNINQTVPGSGFANLSGSVLPQSFTICGLGSEEIVDGDFDINVTWKLESSKWYPDGAVGMSLAEKQEGDVANKQIFVWYGNFTATGRVIEIYGNDNGTLTRISQIPANFTNSTVRVVRRGNNFTFYDLNESGGNWVQLPVSRNYWNLSRALHVHIAAVASYPFDESIAVSVSQVSVNKNTTYSGLFNYSSQLGNYNVTFHANDTLLRRNDSETTNFTIVYVNDRPSTPYILTPNVGETMAGIYNISWLPVTDEEGHTLEYNITLLNATGGFVTQIASGLGPSNLTLYSWDTTAHSDGQYRLRVTVYENNTPEKLSNSYTMLGPFTITNVLPNVTIIAPQGETYDANKSVIISVNASSPVGIQSVVAQVDTPNGSSYNLTLEKGQESDDFSSDTLNISWFKNADIGGGQTCTVNINGTYPGKGYANISGNGFPNTFSTCGVGSEKRIDGNFKINLTWNWESPTQPINGGVIFTLSEEKTASFSNRQVVLAYGNYSGGVGTATRIYANDNGTMEVITQIPKTIQNSTVKINRTGNNFTFYSCIVGGACQQIPVTRSILNLSRALYLQMGAYSTYPSYPQIAITVDEVNIKSDNLTFGGFNRTEQEGLHNVTITATDTAGGINNSETTTFNITQINDPPSVPYLLAPANGDVWKLTNIIAWIQVEDYEGHNFQYNITLLNPDYSPNQSIVSNYATSNPIYAWDTTTVPDGIYSLNVKVFENETTDKLSNQNTLSGNFTINNKGPRVFDLVPVNGTVFVSGQTVTIGANVTDIVGVDTVLVNITLPDSSVQQKELNFTSVNWYQTLFNDTTQDGQYKALIIANDTYGLVNDTEFTFFIVPNDVPNITVNGPPNGSVFIKNIFNITLNATVEDPNNDSLCVKIYASNETPINTTYNMQARIGACFVQNIETISYNWTSPVIQPTQNTVMLLHFDNNADVGSNATHMYDYSGNGNNGSCNGSDCPGYVSGKIGAALQFSEDTVTVQDSPTLDGMNEITVELWIKPQDVDEYTLLDKNGSYALYTDALGRVNFELNSPDVIVRTTSEIETGKWTMIQATYNGSEMNIYFDGVLQNTASRAGIVADTSSNLSIGTSTEDNKKMDGIIDQVVIHNTSLSKRTLRNHYRLNNGTWYWYVHASDFINSTDSGLYNIIINNNNKPTIDQVILNSTNGTDYTEENLTRYIMNATDLDNHEIRNITNWKLNNQSFATLYMPFEGVEWNETAIAKDYANGNDGKVFNAKYLRNEGYIGGAYEYTTDERINITHTDKLNISNEITMEAWIYPTQFIPDGIIYAKPHTSFGNPYVVYGIGYTSSNNRFDIALADGSTQRNCPTSDNTVNLNTWQHVVATFNGTTAKVYINGEQNSSCSFTEFNISTNNEPVFLGYYPFGNNNYNFEGRLDEVRIYNKTLSAEQIKSLYNNGYSEIVSQETELTQKWQACVTPNDGYEDGTEVCSNNLTIQPKRIEVFPYMEKNTYYLNETVLVRANVTSPLSIDTVTANITYPNGTEIQINLSFISGSEYGRNFTDIMQRGRYNISFWANNSGGAVNNSETTYFIRKAPGTRIIDIVRTNMSYLDYSTTVLTNNSGILKLNETITNSKVKNIEISQHYEESYDSVIIIEEDLSDPDLFNYSYLINMDHINMTESNFTINATGNYLYKCVDFNSTTQKCNDDDNYTTLRTNLIPGQTYTITLNSTDPIFGETIQGPANTSDSYIRGGAADRNFGGLNRIRVGRTGAANPIRGIVRFNLSNIPAGATILSANLSLYFYNIPTGDVTTNRTHGAYRVQQNPARDWTELNVTWNKYNATTNWTTQGGDFNATPTDTVIFDNTSLNNWITWDVKTDVQDFINNQSTNFGWIIKDTTENISRIRRDYRSSNYGTASQRPKLTISYNSKPSIDAVILNSTLGTNYTDENLTRYIINATDPEGDPIKNITQWFVNGTSLMRILMPFEATGGNESTWTKDYVQTSGRNITINGATWNRTGGYDGFGAYEYGGDGDTIRNNLTCDGATEVTVTVWVKSDVTNTDNGIWIGRAPDGTDSVCGLRYDAAGAFGGGTNLIKAGFTVNNGSGDVDVQIESANNTQTTDWQFLALTWKSGDVVRLYINGIETTPTYQDPARTGGLSGTTGVRIGIGAKDTGSTGWDGYIDDFTVYTRKLTPEQILALYNNRTDRIVNNETSIGDTLRACVTPNDNYRDGDKVCSNNLTIQNRKPTINAVILNSTLGTNLTTENLTRYIINATDLDGHEIKNITNWYVDNKSLTVLNMPFEANDGNEDTSTKDYSNYQNGTIINNVFWNKTGGYDGFGAYHFNETGYIRINENDRYDIFNDTKKTIMFWYKHDMTASQSMVSKSPVGLGSNGFGWDVRLSVSDAPVLFYNNGSGSISSLSSGINTNFGNWYHVAVTIDREAEFARFYLNGTEVANKSLDRPGTWNNGLNANIGGRGDGGAPFNGTIDEVYIFNRTLSAEQIQAYYNNRTDLIVSQETEVGEIWKACVTPNDGYEDGTEVCSNNLTIIGKPIANNITNPLNGTCQKDFRNITWINFTDPAEQTITYNVTLRNATTQAVLAIINGSTTNNYTPINYSNYTEGRYMIMVEGCNAQGCANSTTIFFIDYTAPNVTLNSPPDNQINDTLPLVNITFNCSATDNTRLVNISLYITNSTTENFSIVNTTALSGRNGSAEFTLELGRGSYKWSCKAVDCTGNTAFADNRTLKITDWTSIRAGQSEIGSFQQCNCTDYKERIRIEFNATKNATYGLFSSFDLVKLTNNGTGDDVYAKALIDDIEISEERIRTLVVVNDSKEAGIIPELFNVSKGRHNLTIEFKIENGSFLARNIDINLIELTSAHNETVRGQQTTANYVHTQSGTTYYPSFNWTIQKINGGSNTFIAAKGVHSVNLAGRAISYEFQDLTNNEVSPTWEAIEQQANVGISMAGNWIFMDHKGEVNMSIGSRNYQAGTVTTVNMTIVDIDLEDEGLNYVNSFSTTNPLSNYSQEIVINDTWTNLVSDNITLKNGTGLFIAFMGTFQLQTGDTTPQNVIHKVNVTGANCSSTKNRTLRGSLDAANGFTYFTCKNLTPGNTYTVNVWTRAAPGRVYNHYDEALSAFEINEFEINVTVVMPPKVVPLLNGEKYLLNETALIRANITDSAYPIDTAYAMLTTPNGSTYRINLTNITGDTYGANWTNMMQRGRYNISYYANNTAGLFNDTSTSYFIRIPLDVIDVVDINYSFLNFSTNILVNTSNILDLNVSIHHSKIKNIEVDTHYYNDWHSILMLDTRNPYNGTSFSIFGIDGTEINYSQMNVWANSSGDNQIYKCLNWSMQNRSCLDGNWTLIGTVNAGQVYNFTIDPGDPGFLETSAAVDVALAPIANESFVLAFIDQAANNLSFKILNTNGSIIVNTVVVDGTVDGDSKVSIGAINSTHFAIAWIDGPANDLRAAIYNFSGVLKVGPATLDANVGLNTDVSVAQIGDRFVVCNANDADNDADYRIIFNNGTLALGESTVDGAMNPQAPLQNLVECTGINSTTWAYFWYRAGFFFFFDQARHETLDEQGNTLNGPTNIDTNILANFQVATTTLDDDKYALAWYDGSDEDITFAIVWANNGSNKVGPTDIDIATGADVRIATATIRRNDTASTDLFVVAYWDDADDDIKATVYDSNGAPVTAPFVVDSQVNTTFRLLDVTARDPITGNTICPGYFVVAYSNASGAGVFKGFNVNGSAWNGVCGRADLIPLDITFSNNNPDENENITIFSTILNNGTGTANNFIVQFYDGQCGNGTQINGNVTITQLKGGQNTTINVTWIAFPVGPHNISVCVDVANKVPESNETNNNLTVPLNVKAYNDYYGDIGGNITLDTEQNETEYDWNSSIGNIYFIDSDNDVDFEALQALGRNTTGGISSNDFQDADINLNMTGFNDSIQILWAINESLPKQTTTFIVRGITITNVPYINSTNNSNFVTGILWDTSKDTNGEYDTTDKEPLVFVGNLNPQAQGKFGIYDYEIHVPVLLRTYNSTTSLLEYYIDLQ